jgi:hypothetical protein
VMPEIKVLRSITQSPLQRATGSTAG